MRGFWDTLKKPILALAPMANVTDEAFRRIIAKYGKPDVMFTEFVSADGLMSAGREKLLADLAYSKSERPIVAQLFSGSPEKMFEAGKLVKTLGFDGIDINMGCPDRTIEKQGAGAALMKTPKLARAIIRAAKEGAGGDRGIPVSVKTRVGYNEDELKTWLPELLSEEPAVVTIHARTRKEMSDVPARWDKVAEAVALRDRLGSKTLIFGNGDVADLAAAQRKVLETGCDGVMLGRAIFGRPELFSNSHELENSSAEAIKSRLNVMLEHTLLFEKLFKGVKSFAVMKKHFKAYVEGFSGARGLRATLMKTETAAEVEHVIAEFLRCATL